MDYLTLFYLQCFIGHGFCDFIPLLQTFHINVLLNYIFLIFINCYIHCLSQSFSTLVFVLLSSIHLSGDFYPFNTIKFPGIGLFLLGMPIIGDYKLYYEILEFIGIYNIDLFLILMLFGGMLSIINNLYENRYSFLVVYILLSYFWGIKTLIFYMIYFHTTISICILCEKYDMDKILTFLLFGTITSTITHIFFYNEVELVLLNYKDYFIGSLYGLLNSHSLTTIYWRYNEKCLR